MTDAPESRSLRADHPTRVALETVRMAAEILFDNGQTTERTLVALERLGHALDMPVTLHPHWGELIVQLNGAPFIIPAKPLAVDIGKVQATMEIVDQVSGGMVSCEGARSALAAVARRPLAGVWRLVLFAALGASALGVIFGALDARSLLLIALSAGAGALLRYWLARVAGNPFVQPLCAAALAGAIGAISIRFDLSDAQRLVAFCPCMMLVPGPHILNGAIDLVRTRIALGIARLTYAGLILLVICIGLLLGLAAGGAHLPSDASSGPVPLAADIVAAGCAVAAFGTFFKMPWGLLPIPIAVGMAAHAARWALVSLAGADVAVGALVASILVGIIVTPIADRLHLPFAALGFSAVVSMMPGFFLFSAASALVELVSLGQRAPATLLSGIVANGTTAFLIILAMTFGLILPRMLFERFLPPAAKNQRPAAQAHRRTYPE